MYFALALLYQQLQTFLGSKIMSNSQDSKWDDLVEVVVQWLQHSPIITMDISFASWLDTDGYNLLKDYQVPN